MDVILTAAVTANGMIARKSSEVVEWSKDLHLFRRQTMGQTVIMGSKTAATLATDLDGRETIIVHRDMEPKDVLQTVMTDQCFIIGGARTYSCYLPYLSHLYVTYHPLIFPSDSLPLFWENSQHLELEFQAMEEMDANKGIYQFQYRVVGR